MEILVKAQESSVGGYERGDIVIIKEDGHKWGLEEKLPKFYLLKVTGKQGIPSLFAESTKQGKRRDIKVNLDEIPFDENGVFSFDTFGSFISFVKSK